MPEQKLVGEDLAAYWTGRPTSTIRRWGLEGRITRHEDHSRRKNGVLYDLDELPVAERNSDTMALIKPAKTPKVMKREPLQAAA
ncbi:DNA-binding protein [Streptomyces sp. W4I9-2]|uniref:DNA-binding protein n=1 Tax=Streptomyces sp. W4I9-2 TaxID=3042297 RepID=UPI00277DE041|nr:DNA-binding protein [Streptomyces sp. W4I9-2]MDQ0694220.1 hypothetical protein [Streptomyces sp. W4I9-2]